MSEFIFDHICKIIDTAFEASVGSICLTLSQDIVRTVWNDVGYLQKLSKINCRQHKEFSNLTSAIQVELIEVSRVVLS